MRKIMCENLEFEEPIQLDLRDVPELAEAVEGFMNLDPSMPQSEAVVCAIRGLYNAREYSKVA